MIKLDSILESRAISLPTKVHIVKAMVFPVVMYGCESWTINKAEHQSIDASELWCWRRLSRVPWTARTSNPRGRVSAYSPMPLDNRSGSGTGRDPEEGSGQFSRLVMSDSLQHHELQHARLPCPSPTPRAYSNSCPLSQWCHPTISSSVIPFPPTFNLAQHQGLFQWVRSSHQVAKVLGVSASALVLQINIQDWFPLGLTGWISLPSKELSRVFSNTTVQKHQFFGTQPSL